MKSHPKRPAISKIILRILLLVILFTLPLFIFDKTYLQLPYDIILNCILFFSAIGFYSTFLWLYTLIAKKEKTPTQLEQHLPLIIDEAYAICHDDGIIEYATPFFYTLLEYNSIAKHNMYSILEGDEELNKTLYTLKENAKNGQTGTARIVLHIGSKKIKTHFDITLKPYNYNKKQHQYILFKFTPVDTEKDALQTHDISALQEIVNRLDQSPLGVFSCTYDGQITYANVPFVCMVGLDSHILTEKLPNIRDIFPLKTIEEMLSNHQQTNHTSITTSFEKNNDTNHLLTVIKHNNSNDTSLFHHFVTLEQKWINETIQHNTPQSKPLYYTQSPLGIGYIDYNGRILEANQKFCTFFDSENIVSKNFSDLLDEHNKKEFYIILNTVRQNTSSSYPLTINFVQKAKKSAQFQFIIENTNDSNGNDEKRILTFLVDMTEKYILEESHAQSQKMQAIGQLAGGIAHDFNNVLTGIIGASDILLTSMSPSSKQFDEVIQIKNNANRAANLVQHLMAFSRKQKLKPIVLSISEVINADFKNLIQKLITSKIKLQTNINRDLWFIKADGNQLEQVIINLAINARDAMPNGGELLINAYNISEIEKNRFDKHKMPAKEYVCIEVKDNGTGIAEDLIDNIFEPFFTTKETGKGTGMGLSTVYGIVKQSEGHIFVDSQNDKGTTFSIYLPHHPADLTDYQIKENEKHLKTLNQKTSSPKKVSDYTGSREKILLVEDEDSVRSFATRALTQQGYTVSEASGGLEALDLIEKGHNFDLIISDVLMPGMDGPTLITEMRKKIGITPTIFISGYADDAFNNDIDEDSFIFLAKPFGIKQLVEAVKNTLGQNI